MQVRNFSLVLGWALALCVSVPAVRAECPPNDLFVNLTTGYDEDAASTIASGSQDDDWTTTVDPSGGVVPDATGVITAHPAWLTFPGSKWIAADKYGPNGEYVYETCWCMDHDYQQPVLGFEIRADDQADVYLNGNLIVSTVDGTFNDSIVPTYQFSNPALFQAGENCLEVHVENKYGVVTGLNLQGTMSAVSGECCECSETDIVDDCSTGIDDNGNEIPSSLDDDDWTVTAAASGGTLPRWADVIDTFVGWNVIPGTKWISADENGPNGLYTYEKCWCMNAAFEDPQLDIELLADDRADVYVNGNLLGSTPATNAFLFPATVLSTSDPDDFQAGENCVTIDVQNVSSVVTGLNVKMDFSATNAECCDCYPIPPDAEGWWPLDETSGIIAEDILNAHNGFKTEFTATPPPPTPTTGQVNGGLLLDGVDDYVRVPHHPALDFGPGQDFSIDAWVRTTSLTRQAIVSKKEIIGGPLTPGYSFLMGNGWLFLEMGDGSNTLACIGSTNLADGNWHFVAVSVDRDQTDGIKLYADGAIEAVCDPTSVSGDLSNGISLYFGGDPLHAPGGEIWWDGTLDEIEIFRRALAVSEFDGIYSAGNVGKCPLEDCEDSTGVPVCDGLCPVGEACVEDLSGMGHCSCEPESTSCETSGAPVCDGPCPDPDDVCRDADMDGHCECTTPALCEGMETFPECDGLCPDSDSICQSNGQRCHCVPPNPCELSPYPECGGTCNDPNAECVPDLATGLCSCEYSGPPPCEGFATYPECDGWCDDPAAICVNNGQRCHCVTEIMCETSLDFPTCGGDCPVGTTCAPDPFTDFCKCVADDITCGDTFFPECGGSCPTGEECKNIPGTDNCQCEPEIPPCSESAYPDCDGTCPDDESCRPDPGNQVCVCQDCDVVGPDGVDDPILVHAAKGDKIRWTPTECALVYNVYRYYGVTLLDALDDGLADDYGVCYIEDIIGLDVEDHERPQPGLTQWYLVTGENFVSETTAGTNSAGADRPLIHCP